MARIDVLTLEDLHKKNIDGYLPVLLEVYNPDISWTDEEKEAYDQEDSYIRFISDEVKVVYKGKTYLPCNFDYQLPESDGTKIGTTTITISALDARVRKLLRSISLPSEIKVVAMFAKITKDEDSGSFFYKFVELNTMKYGMTTAGSNRMSATFNLVFNDASSQSIPYDTATQDRVPAVGAK